MATDDESGNVPAYRMSDLARALDSHTDESLENLNKAETVFYLCDVLGVEPPEAHPSEHNGTVPRSLSQKFAKVLADYGRRNGFDAFHADDVLADDGNDENDDTDAQADENDDEDN